MCRGLFLQARCGRPLLPWFERARPESSYRPNRSLGAGSKEKEQKILDLREEEDFKGRIYFRNGSGDPRVFAD